MRAGRHGHERKNASGSGKNHCGYSRTRGDLHAIKGCLIRTSAIDRSEQARLNGGRRLAQSLGVPALLAQMLDKPGGAVGAVDNARMDAFHGG